MHLVVIIPCLNEEETIGSVISSIPHSIPGISKISILVVDDGSHDASASKAKDFGAQILTHPEPRGVGVAIHSGIEHAVELRADLAVTIDGDGQFNAQDIPKLTQPIIANQADFVTASRFLDSDLEPHMPCLKKWGNKQLARFISLLTGHKFYDVSCGFRAYSKEAILQLNLMGKFTYTQETFLDLAFKGLRIQEVPVQVRGEREFGKSRVASNIPKYAWNTSKIILRSFRDYKPLRFFGGIACALFSASFLLGAFFFNHYLQTGQFSGHLWAGFSSGFLLLFSFLSLITGLLADMFDRIRQNQEKLLYYEKKKIMDQSSD